REAIAAATLLNEDFGVAADVWSVTSFSELARDGMRAERAHRAALADARLEAADAGSWIDRSLSGTGGPIVAATDYMRLVAESVRPWMPQGRRYVTLGTDGFGRSDSRAQLRRFFEVDARAIAFAAITALCDEGALPLESVAEAARRW